MLENPSRPSDIHLEVSTVHTLVLLYHIIDALGQLWGSHFKVGLAGFFLITSYNFWKFLRIYFVSGLWILSF